MVFHSEESQARAPTAATHDYWQDVNHDSQRPVAVYPRRLQTCRKRRPSPEEESIPVLRLDSEAPHDPQTELQTVQSPITIDQNTESEGEEPNPNEGTVMLQNRVPCTIHRFAYFGPRCFSNGVCPRSWSKAIADLASQAQREDWTGPNFKAPNNILDHYISYTYLRLVAEGKISINRDATYATFNTGLLTENAAEIFGYFSRNSHERKQPWFFEFWATESDPRLTNQFQDLPGMAKYSATPADLVFDVDRSFYLNVERIIASDLERFPSNIQDKGMARIALNQAVAVALKRARREYKLAIPLWYPEMGATDVQLLLPLSVGKVDINLALVVEKAEGYGYLGEMVWPLDIARCYARIVTRPFDDWLHR